MSLTHRSAADTELIGRRLEGVAYQYGYPSQVADDGWSSSYYEEIIRGADNRTLAHRAAFPLTRLRSSDGGLEAGVVRCHGSDDERALLFCAVVDTTPEDDEPLEEWGDASVTYEPLRSG